MSQRDREPLELREKLLLWVSGVLIVFLGWSLGGLRVWAPPVHCALGLLALATQFHPFGKFARDRNRENWGRLRGFVPFWLGGAFVLYVLLQALNPAWLVRSTGENAWMLAAQTPLPFLPTSVEAPYAEMNAWRMLLTYGGAWLWLAALAAGLRPRRAVRLLGWVSLASAALMAGVGFAIKLSGSAYILGMFESENTTFFGTFIYRNHAAPFLYLNMAIALGLAFLLVRRDASSLNRSSLALGAFGLALVFFIATFATGSRGGMTIGLLIAFIALMLAPALVSSGLNWKTGLFGTVVIAGFVVAIFYAIVPGVDLNNIQSRWEIVAEEGDRIREEGIESAQDHNIRMRYNYMVATSEMFAQRPVTGWGAGSYRWAFREIQHQYPHLTYRGYWARKLQYWGVNHAHTDWLQFPAEYGLIGASLALAALLALIAYALGGGLPSFVLLLGGLGVILHASFEFVLQNPSVLYLTLFLIFAAGKLAHTRSRKPSRKSEPQPIVAAPAPDPSPDAQQSQA